jgi:hypothetical protein
MRSVPSALVDDILDRYGSIGSRLDRLYKVVFGTTYTSDMTELGFKHVRDHLLHVQKQRNQFVHGDPAAISDALVIEVVAQLKNEHEAWIAVFNRHRGRS